MWGGRGLVLVEGKGLGLRGEYITRGMIADAARHWGRGWGLQL